MVAQNKMQKLENSHKVMPKWLWYVFWISAVIVFIYAISFSVFNLMLYERAFASNYYIITGVVTNLLAGIYSYSFAVNIVASLYLIYKAFIAKDVILNKFVITWFVLLFVPAIFAIFNFVSFFAIRLFGFLFYG